MGYTHTSLLNVQIIKQRGFINKLETPSQAFITLSTVSYPDMYVITHQIQTSISYDLS